MVFDYNMTMKINYSIIIILFSFVLHGQDRHFSQFYASPLTLNPALTGMYDGSYRVTSNYRSQWSSWIQKPVNTYSIGADLRIDNPFSSISKDKIGIGLLFFRDEIADIGLNTNQILISLSYQKLLDKITNQYLSFGLQTGLSQRSILFESLIFPDQWNGYGQFTSPTGEILPENNYPYTDLNTGLNYSYAPKNSFSFNLGIGLHHFLKPNYSFYSNDPTKKNTESKLLYPKLTTYFNANFIVGRQFSLLPRAVFMKQNEHYELTAGNIFKFQFSKESGNSLHVGAWARGVTNINKQFDLDAIVFLTGFELNSVLLGFSYDLSLSGLKYYKNPTNAFEFSIIYMGDYNNDVLLCPSF
jgi:type IX secretion system PorP/SprF family membrane protein